MNDETIERLNRLNLDFYSGRADDFSRTRETPWPGWERLVDTVLEGHSGKRPGKQLAILDVGCGNARFAGFLHQRIGGFDYQGVDSSRELLGIATAILAALPGVASELLEIDLARQPIGDLLGDFRFDLIAAFGLIHHIPGLEQRRALLADLAQLLHPGGHLAIAFWQFADSERFQRRMVAWSDFNDTSAEPVDLEQLEPGDHLLTWGQRSTAVRYCHHSDDAEVEDLTSSLGLEPAESFRSAEAIDRLNRYELMRRP